MGRGLAPGRLCGQAAFVAHAQPWSSDVVDCLQASGWQGRHPQRENSARAGRPGSSRPKAGHPSRSPRSAIRVHRDLSGLISAAQEVICTFGWFHDPTAAVLVCVDQNEAVEIEALLRANNEQDRGQDLLLTAKELAEGLLAPSPEWRYLGPSPVLLASEIHAGARWREVFLSPGCRNLQSDQVLAAVGAAGVGVHVVASAGTSPTGRDDRKRVRHG